MKPFDTAGSPAQENAMTEIALALAMGFFSIMVLTMISMGAGDAAPAPARPSVLDLIPAASAEAKDGKARRPHADDLIVIYDEGRYLDTSLKAVDPKALIGAMPDPGRRVVLALDPSLSIKQAMAARRGIEARHLVVSSLDERWLRALAAKKGGGNVR